MGSPYLFGLTSQLVGINFPVAQPQTPLQPWYWWVLYQIPAAFSFLGKFALTPGFQEIVGDTPGAVTQYRTIPPIGYQTLEDAILNGNPTQAGTTPSAPVSALQGDFGIFDFENTGPSPDGGSNDIPSIWQLCGLNAPKLKNNSLPFIPSLNPYNPTAAQTKAAAGTFLSFWNQCANNWNVEYLVVTVLRYINAPGFADSGYPQGGAVWSPSSGFWPWRMPYWNAFFPAHVQAFQSGIPIGMVGGVQGGDNAGFGPLSFYCNTAWTIGVGQLNPKTWNTQVYPPTLIPQGD